MENNIDFKSLFESMKNDRDEELKSYDDDGIKLLYKAIIPKYWESFKKIKDEMTAHQIIEKKMYGIILEMYVRELEIDEEISKLHLNILENL